MFYVLAFSDDSEDVYKKVEEKVRRLLSEDEVKVSTEDSNLSLWNLFSESDDKNGRLRSIFCYYNIRGVAIK